MHEVGIIQQALDVALDAAIREGATRICRVRLRIGAMAGVVPEALEFAYPLVTEGTMAEGSTLEWERVPVLCRCAQGCPDFEPDEVAYACPVCGAYSADLVTGRELQVADIEVE